MCSSDLTTTKKWAKVETLLNALTHNENFTRQKKLVLGQRRLKAETNTTMEVPHKMPLTQRQTAAKKVSPENAVYTTAFYGAPNGGV